MNTRLLKKTLKYIFLLIITVVLIVIILFSWSRYINSSAPNDKWFSFIYPSFYIKVVDEHKVPIPNALIKYTNGYNSWIGSNKSFSSIYTDGDGLAKFYLDKRGFNIEKIEKNGYSINHHEKMNSLSDDNVNRVLKRHVVAFTSENPLIIVGHKTDE